jgi:hypothetical protein
VCLPRCARPTGGSHTRTPDAPAQRFEGAKLRAAPDRSKGAAKGIIEAGAPAFGCTVHPLRLQAPRAAYAHKSPGQGNCTATPGWSGGRDGRKSIKKSKIIDTGAADSHIGGNVPYLLSAKGRDTPKDTLTLVVLIAAWLIGVGAKRRPR